LILTDCSFERLFLVGIWTEDQVKGWRNVTDAVHEKNGYIVCQLWHTGRVAHAKFADAYAVVREGLFLLYYCLFYICMYVYTILINTFIGGNLPPVSASATPIKGRDDVRIVVVIVGL
jgi:2,4-dienoyl-CoA reductase-like NADH-dependent reductase (Old Yellow Enzyme family)